MIDKLFSCDDIFKYVDINSKRHNLIFNYFYKRTKKVYPSNLLDKKKLHGWIKQHIDKKPEYWFIYNKEENKFKLNTNKIKLLDNDLEYFNNSSNS